MLLAKAMAVCVLRDGVVLQRAACRDVAGMPRMHEWIRGAESTCECVQNTSNLVVRAGSVQVQRLCRALLASISTTLARPLMRHTLF